MPFPFEVTTDYLSSHIEDMVDATFESLQSQFLVLPKGPSFVDYADFRASYEILKRQTESFTDISPKTIAQAVQEQSLCMVVLRTILGMTPPEWAEIAQTETGITVPQNFARNLDSRCRRDPNYLSGRLSPQTQARIQALVETAVVLIHAGAPSLGAADTVHRLAKADTAQGLESLQHVATQDVPYPVLLYERYLGRPFASHRDSVSELVGDVMEAAVDERLFRAGISYRRTRRAERVPGFEQAPDFFVPDEFEPIAVIEAKITGDDGTARDKATRIVNLANMSEERERRGARRFEVIACIDGRGFGVRREDMRRMLLRTSGKIFTLSTLDQLIPNTVLAPDHELNPAWVGVPLTVKRSVKRTPTFKISATIRSGEVCGRRRHSSHAIVNPLGRHRLPCRGDSSPGMGPSLKSVPIREICGRPLPYAYAYALCAPSPTPPSPTQCPSPPPQASPR